MKDQARPGELKHYQWPRGIHIAELTAFHHPVTNPPADLIIGQLASKCAFNLFHAEEFLDKSILRRFGLSPAVSQCSSASQRICSRLISENRTPN